MSWLRCISLSNGMPCTPPSHCVIALGNFDGVHIAHRALIKHAVELRALRFSDAACGVFFFSPPSSDFIFENPPAHLSMPEQKLTLLKEAGAEYAFLADFSQMRNLSPAAFIQTVLLEQCHAVAAVCGFNYRFGKGGEGTPEALRSILSAPVSVLEKVSDSGECISSTRIRILLLDGEAELAAKLLGRPYSFSSEVIHGKSLGHQIGFPTINQHFPSKLLIPRHGVYITRCEGDGICAIGISNVGVHPTVDSKASVNCETHLLHVSENLYGKELKISFLRFIRPEQKFDSLVALQRQIQMDKRAAEAYNNQKSGRML